MYKRVLLKLSGEALAAPDFPFSTEVLESIGKQVKKISDMGIGVGAAIPGVSGAAIAVIFTCWKQISIVILLG